jgi:hypothetical protein
MPTTIRLLSASFLCLSLFVSCSNNDSDCNKNVQLLQGQLIAKGMRIASLEDSLQKQMNPSGLSATANSGAAITTQTITAETSFYKSDKNKPNKKNAVTDKKYAGEFPEGSSKILADKNLEFLSKWGLKVMLNEIYARHGMTFTDGDLQNHFNHESWYMGTRDHVDALLSDIEKKNIIFINNYKFTPQIPA